MGVYLLADLDWWLDFGNWNSLIRMALGLGFVIFVHELGHFLVAKACGVKCEKFYVGFDPPFKYLPRTLWKKKWGETEYGIGIIPLGGYVKMLGQDDNPANAAREAERIRLAHAQNSDEPADAGDGYVLDPRSYPAKSVPQRMAIISAGVIMNMIFAVIFGAVAYQFGVSYIPTYVGATIPGDPAWQAGLQPGDKIIQLGADADVDEQLSWKRDLRFAVAATGSDGELEMRVRHTDDTVEVISIQPSSTLQKEIGFATIGIEAARTNKVESGKAASSYVAKILKTGKSDSESPNPNELVHGDQVMGIHAGSKDYSINERNAFQIASILARHAVDEMTFDVERSADEGSDGGSAVLPTKRSVTVAPIPMNTLGITMEPGPIVAIKRESPAEQVGLKVGDVITAVAGQPVLEPLRIDHVLQQFADQSTELTVKRDGTEIAVTITPQQSANANEARFPGGPIAAESIGVAIGVTNVVRTADARLADKIHSGDSIEKASFVADKDSKLSPDQILKLGLSKPLPIGGVGDYSWADLIEQIQIMPADMGVDLTISRGKKQEIVELKPIRSNDWFQPSRDIVFQNVSDVRQAAGLGEAFRLGLRETWAGVEAVIYTLKNIGRHYKQLGGPLTIAYVATSEASEGMPRLLIFLTLLSTNLAIINFLPIPVLDGGHMMFLLAEGIRGKPINERWAFYLTMVGFSFILALMVFVLGLDLNRFFPGLSG